MAKIIGKLTEIIDQKLGIKFRQNIKNAHNKAKSNHIYFINIYEKDAERKLTNIFMKK